SDRPCRRVGGACASLGRGEEQRAREREDQQGHEAKGRFHRNSPCSSEWAAEDLPQTTDLQTCVGVSRPSSFGMRAPPKDRARGGGEERPRARCADARPRLAWTA